MVRKKTTNNLKMKIYTESLSKEEKYISEKKKKRPTLSYQLKKIKRHVIG